MLLRAYWSWTHFHNTYSPSLHLYAHTNTHTHTLEAFSNSADGARSSFMTQKFKAADTDCSVLKKKKLTHFIFIYTNTRTVHTTIKIYVHIMQMLKVSQPGVPQNLMYDITQSGQRILSGSNLVWNYFQSFQYFFKFI